MYVSFNMVMVCGNSFIWLFVGVHGELVIILLISIIKGINLHFSSVMNKRYLCK